MAKITATYETPLSVPVRYPMIMAAGQEVVEQSYIEVGRHDSYDRDMVKYVAGEQFAFTATVNAAGAIQIAGTAQPEQLPFFIAACDYTLMGEELYAASSYLSREPLLLGGLKGQDFIKMILVFSIIVGVIFATFKIGNWFISLFRIP